MAGQVRRAGAVLAAGARVRAMAAGPGDLLVVATDDGRVTAWDVATRTARFYLPGTVPGLTGREVRVRCLALDLPGTWPRPALRGGSCSGMWLTRASRCWRPGCRAPPR